MRRQQSAEGRQAICEALQTDAAVLATFLSGQEDPLQRLPLSIVIAGQDVSRLGGGLLNGRTCSLA